MVGLIIEFAKIVFWVAVFLYIGAAALNAISQLSAQLSANANVGPSIDVYSTFMYLKYAPNVVR